MTTHLRRRSAALVVIVLAGLMSTLLLARLAGAATITVGPGCTLRDAIVPANTDTAIGGCVAGSGVTVLFEDAQGQIRGATGVAVATQ